MAFNLLVVDDSSLVRKVIRKTLGMTDISINHLYEAENGADALKVLRSQWIDLVFLDINMPVMNGIEFLEHVRASDDVRDMAVIVVSTEGASERIDKLKEMGVKAYLHKPVTPESLCESVKEVLGSLGND